MLRYQQNTCLSVKVLKLTRKHALAALRKRVLPLAPEVAWSSLELLHLLLVAQLAALFRKSELHVSSTLPTDVSVLKHSAMRNGKLLAASHQDSSQS